MLEELLKYERDFFFAINHISSSFSDGMMWIYSYTKAWIPFFAIILFGLVFRKKPVDWISIIIAIVVVVGLCDFFSSGICKPLFARPRPTHHPDFMNDVKTLYGYMGGKYGFISGHAANSFGIAAFSALLFRNRYYTIVIMFWATIVALSRVYLGAHFISDIVAGAISGIAIAALVYLLYKLCYIKLLKKESLPVFARKLTNTITIVLLCYMVLIAAASPWLVSMIKG